MKVLIIASTLALAPALAGAQASVSAQSQTGVTVSRSASQRRLSADAQAKVDANIRAATEMRLPDEPIRRRVAEGQAKGASEAQIVAASGRTLVDLQSSFDAMVRGGHSAPSDEEIARGAQLIARGYTTVQLEGVARRAPSDRSLVVAFETLTSLQARGASTAHAVAQLESLLAARASDSELRGAAVSGSATGAVAGTTSIDRGVAGTASGTTAATGAANAAGATAGATAGVTGAVSGVLGRKP